MNSFKKWNNLVGWLVFAVTATVFFFSAERTGSLWDCGEFVAGAYKLQVVHPPGAPLFLMLGKLATVVGQMFSSDPAVVAFSVNVLSGICTALAATFICWSTIILGKLALIGRDDEPTVSQFIAIAGSGIVAGLATAFATSIWFSAVEGEVYAMSTMFTALTLWTMLKWYNLPDTPDADRWIILTVYVAALSIGVHLLSLLTFPALALFYYFKKNTQPTFKGMAIAGIAGIVAIFLIQTLVITGIPMLWGNLEIFCVNTLGLPFSIPSLILMILVLGGCIYAGLQMAAGKSSTVLTSIYVVTAALWILSSLSGSAFKILLGLAILGGSAYYLIQRAERGSSILVQNIMMSLAVAALGFSTIGMVLIRANANPPINMNNPNDPIRVIPYINREQYGERPLLFGPAFNVNSQKATTITEDRYARVGNSYDPKGDKKFDQVFEDPNDKMFFPRMGHWEQDRVEYYKHWMGIEDKRDPRSGRMIPTPVPAGRPDAADNFSYFFRYQVGWMYWRYFMWNFSGRQNAEQGFGPWEKSKGNWVSGISFLDDARLYSYKDAPDTMKHDPAYNRYYMLPLLFGLFGLVWHYGKRRYDMLGLLALFIITGLGIIVYTNEPPNEPRERDYVIVGSIFTFAMWIGMGVLAVFDLLKDFKFNERIAAPIATLLVLVAPALMGFENFDDHSRAKHSAARDYAVNFLESCDKNAILFTYGDNDTYPLWYAQEVEGIRRDIRVVNLSLIAVDWYIDQMRRKVNESPAIKMTMGSDQIRGYRRMQIPIQAGTERSVQDFLKFINEEHPLPAGSSFTFESYGPSKLIYLPIDKQKMVANGIASAQDSIVDRIPMSFEGRNYLIKDDLAILDIIANNAHERPIYFAVTCRTEKLQGLQDYTQLEGLALRFRPVKSPGQRMFGLGIIESGAVATDKIVDRVTNKFRWGNFDKEKTFINRSYMPSIQTTQFVILRTVFELLRDAELPQNAAKKEEMKQKAVKLLDKNFEAFPNFNFPYGSISELFIEAYVQAGAMEQAKKHIGILGNNILQNMKFYASLDAADREGTFGQDYGMDMQTMTQILGLANKTGDAQFAKEWEDKLKPYQVAPLMK